jgi:1,4-dihydroxy-2-naphthoyl-CoA hydrolase
VIWHSKPTADGIKALGQDTMAAYLGFEVTEIGDDFLSARIPVDHRTVQPYGILHGGASVMLVETLGSIASHYCIDNTKLIAVGLEVNGNHIRQVRSGWVHGTARAIHLGKKTHVWDIRVVDDAGKLIHIGRLTTAILERPDLG